MFNFLANPARFNRIADRLMPAIAGLGGVFLSIGIIFALIISPPDYQQGHTVRIMYVHVPSAWMALFTYSFIATTSGIGLIWRHPLAHLFAQAAAPIGITFTLLCLITGSLWGKPMWGTWWVWDARLTSVLFLFFLYLGFMALNNSFDDPFRGERSAAILALVGFINVPVIKFSVDWWNTLHQPASLLRVDGPAIHSSMLTPLFLMALGFTFVAVCVLITRIKILLIKRRIRLIRINKGKLRL